MQRLEGRKAVDVAAELTGSSSAFCSEQIEPLLYMEAKTTKGRRAPLKDVDATLIGDDDSVLPRRRHLP